MTRRVVIVGGRPDMAAAAVAAINQGGKVVAIHGPPSDSMGDYPVVSKFAQSGGQIAEALAGMDPAWRLHLLGVPHRLPDVELPPLQRERETTPTPAPNLTRQQRRYQARKGRK